MTWQLRVYLYLEVLEVRSRKKDRGDQGWTKRSQTKLPCGAWMNKLGNKLGVNRWDDS